MNKSSRLIINVLVLMLLLLNPLSSFAATAVEAQSIGSEKSLATVDLTANIKWQGGPEQKPTLWLLLNRKIDGNVEEVPGILPKEVSSVTGPVTWYGLPKYASSGTEIDYRVSQGIWDAIRQKFTEIEPQGYQAFLSPNGLTITNIYIEREIILPVETDEPVLEPVIKETEPPASTPEPPEDLSEPVEQPEEPIDLEDPIEPPVEPIEAPIELDDPIELPIEVTKPPALETPEPVDPPVITPEPTPPAEETPLPKSITVSISWQGGKTPRPAFWLKLQEIDLDGNKSDVAGTEPIKANFASQITWANVESYNVDSSYTVAIVDQTGQATSIPGYTSHIDGLSLTNIWQEQSANDVVAKVEWLYSLEPKEAIGWNEIVDFEIPSVWLRLYRQSGAHEVPVALLSTELKELANGATTAVWADMPKTNSMGVEYIYSVKQVDANGADFSHELFNKVEKGLLVQNIAKDGNGLRDIIDPPAPIHTYNFMVDGTVVDTQMVKYGEFLTEPTVPVKEGQKFTGWYVNGVKIDFTQPVTVSGTDTVEAIAQFAPALYVFFMDGVGTNARVIVTKEGITDGTVSTTDVKPNLGSTQGVTGWYRDKALTDGPVGDTFTIGSTNQVLWPKIETGAYLTFESGDNATYIEPQFVAPGAVTAQPEQPTRPGYTFLRWSLTADGTTPYTFSEPLATNTTVYAFWQAVDTGYTVVFWKQTVSDSKDAADDAKTYDYAESDNARTALPGTSVSPTTADQNKGYPGFHYNAGKSVAVEVKGDGTTVLNVYYDRNLLTVRFYKRSSFLSPWEEWQTMTGLYGQTLAQNDYTWPNNEYWQELGSGSTLGTGLTFLDAFIFDDLGAIANPYPKDTLRLGTSRNASGSYQIRHYKQNLDGNYPTTPANTSPSNGGSFGFTNKYTGFTVAFYRIGNGTWQPTSPDGSTNFNNHLEIRHTRNTYTLSFYNYNGYAKTEQFKYEAPLAGQESYEPPRPSGIPAVYEFQGWFKDTAYTVPFNFANETMPSANLVIYAKWAPPALSGTAHANLEGSGATYTIPVVYNQPIDRSTVPTVVDSVGTVLFQGDDSKTITMPANHKWIGWSTRDGSDYTTFNFNTKILSDITLYPYWVNNEIFHVNYAANGGGGTVPTDGQNYAYGSYADVAALGTLTPPSGQVFLGWLYDGVLYQPGDKIQITGNMTLTPRWGVLAPTTTITYHGNYPYGTNPDDVSETLDNNATHIIKPEGTFAAPAGYEFVAWNTQADGSGTSYAPGTEVMVDNINEENNHLYAQWKRTEVDVTAQKVWVGGHAVNHTLVTLQLYRKTATSAEELVTKTPSVDPPSGTHDTFNYTWKNLYTHTADGQLYTYRVAEPTVHSSYTAVVSGSGYAFTVTNTYHNAKAVQATKYWYTTDTNKPQVWFTLWRRGGTAGTGEPVPGLNSSNVPSGTNTVHWNNLISEDENGVPYDFFVKETDANGNDFTPEGYEKVESGLSVYNYKGSKNISFKVVKDWTNVPAAFRTAFNVQLKQDGGNLGDPVELNAENSYTYTWTELPRYQSGTTLFNYTVEEDTTGFDEGVVLDEITYSGIDETTDTITGTIKNKYVPPMDGTATANKVWMPTNLIDSLKVTVWFKLYRNIDGGLVEEVPGAAIKQLVFPVLTATWTDLQKTDANGKPYIFTVKEVDADGNDWKPDNFTKVEQGLTVTNTYTSPTSGVTANKVWMPAGLDPELKDPVTLELWRKIEGGTGAIAATGLVDGVVDDPCGAEGCEETAWNYTW